MSNVPLELWVRGETDAVLKSTETDAAFVAQFDHRARRLTQQQLFCETQKAIAEARRVKPKRPCRLRTGAGRVILLGPLQLADKPTHTAVHLMAQLPEDRLPNFGAVTYLDAKGESRVAFQSQAPLAAARLTHSSHCRPREYSDCEERGVRNVFPIATAEGKTRRTRRACVAGGGGHAA